MFNPGDLIVYGNSGVCRVESIGTPERGVSDKSAQYYTLCPLYSSETIYTPVDTGVFMRPIISREEAQQFVEQIAFAEATVFEKQNLSLLKEQYNAVMKTHNCEDLLCLVKSVYEKNIDAQQRGKKLGQMDQQYWKRAEELLHGELAAALDIPMENIAAYIVDAVAAAIPLAETQE